MDNRCVQRSTVPGYTNTLCKQSASICQILHAVSGPPGLWLQVSQKHCAINTHLPQAEQLRGDLIRAQFQTGLFLQLPESCIQQLVLDTQKSISHGTVLSLIDSEYYFPFNMLIILQRITYKNKIIKLIMYTTQGLGVSNIFLKKIK